MIILNCVRGLGLIVVGIIGIVVGTAWVLLFGGLVCIPVWAYLISANMGGAKVDINAKMQRLTDIAFWLHNTILGKYC